MKKGKSKLQVLTSLQLTGFLEANVSTDNNFTKTYALPSSLQGIFLIVFELSWKQSNLCILKINFLYDKIFGVGDINLTYV
ncbi:CLUMA_CG017283, isoform A [Clunio marinus]|uniref:CLUMA_CG017283, isoform A n=1 Tax=Clunio marinus TaxID=568069 RepID=A0A1J1IVH6_9DIPT|nr:CLUMA_CG017283, isoform A [Clunio marinus]